MPYRAERSVELHIHPEAIDALLRAGETRDRLLAGIDFAALDRLYEIRQRHQEMANSLGMTYLGALSPLRNLNVTALSPIEPPAIELSPLVFAGSLRRRLPGGRANDYCQGLLR